MRIVRVIGTITLNSSEPNLPTGALLLTEVLDATALDGLERRVPRGAAMGQSLVVFDELGASKGQLVAVSEGGEACSPFRPQQVSIDAYCAAILDHVAWHRDPS